jgi:hypothetical protein
MKKFGTTSEKRIYFLICVVGSPQPDFKLGGDSAQLKLGKQIGIQLRVLTITLH